MKEFDLVVIGGGPAGFFGALRFAQLTQSASILILEKTDRVLQKVLISGGGRCNLSHDCSDPRELIRSYPRGGKSLLTPFYTFGPDQTIAWFQQHGLACYVDPDGCYFPVTNDSQSVVDVLTRTAQACGIRVWTQAGVEAIIVDPDTGQYELTIQNGDTLRAPRILIATGGNRQMLKLLANFGMNIISPVPSLFALQLSDPECAGLSGITMDDVRLSLPGTTVEQRGTLLITHRGFSGPAAINLSAWGARILKEKGYHHPLQVDWLPSGGNPETVIQVLNRNKTDAASKMVINHPPDFPLPARLWQHLCTRSEIPPTTRWADLSKQQIRRLATVLRADEYRIIGRDTHRAEYVTCGGVDLRALDLRKFESREHPGFYFAGEILDVDGLTGGYNLQNCWSTAWVAGTALAADATTPDFQRIMNEGKFEKRDDSGEQYE